MQAKIVTLEPKKLAGQSLTMSYANNLTFQLWSTFSPIKHQLKAINTNLYSLQIYPPDFFAAFNPTTSFEKYALVEINASDPIPEGFISVDLKGGLYAVFDYKGTPAQAAPFFQAIFTQWLPNSVYALDNRPHFELLGEKYKQNDPDSEEEIWIPVKIKE